MYLEKDDHVSKLIFKNANWFRVIITIQRTKIYFLKCVVGMYNDELTVVIPVN